MRTVTELTGIKMDHFMVADFNAVKTLTTAVGGVEVCLAKDIDDPDSHLKLSKGTHTIEGEEALAFVRTRHSVGFGGDLSRIEIQQQFLSSLMRKLSSNDTLTSPTKMFSLAEAGTKALTVDSTLADISKLRDLGMELGKLDPKNLTFATIPVKDNPAEPTPVTVVLDDPKAQSVFQMVREDVSFTAVKKKEKKEKAAVAARLKGERADPTEVRVDVYNGGAATGSAQTTLTWLQNTQGVLKSTQLGNAPEELAKTTVEYGEEEAPQARALADMMGLAGLGAEAGRIREQLSGAPGGQAHTGPRLQGRGHTARRPEGSPQGREQGQRGQDRLREVIHRRIRPGRSPRPGRLSGVRCEVGRARHGLSTVGGRSRTGSGPRRGTGVGRGTVRGPGRGGGDRPGQGARPARCR